MMLWDERVNKFSKRKTKESDLHRYRARHVKRIHLTVSASSLETWELVGVGERGGVGD